MRRGNHKARQAHHRQDNHKTRQYKTREEKQDKMIKGQDKTRHSQGKTRPRQERQGKGRQGNSKTQERARHYKTLQDKTIKHTRQSQANHMTIKTQSQGKTREVKTREVKTTQDKTRQLHDKRIVRQDSHKIR